MKHALTLVLVFLVASAPAAEPKRKWTSPKSPDPEYGYGLTDKEAAAGWISLFDGKTTFGWRGAKAEDGLLIGGETTTPFGSQCEIKGEVIRGSELRVAGAIAKVPKGPLKFVMKSSPALTLPIELGKDTAVSRLMFRPLGLQSVFNGKDLSGWKVLRHPRRPADQQAMWTIERGVIRGVGGPGALELQQRFGDLVLQIDVRTRGKLSNGGVFFRAIPGDFMNGYEAQVFNACYDHDPAKPARYSTGGLDDRQLARRLVSRDGKTFTMTVIANGPHIATWVNGYQMTDWTDTRKPHENARQGLRTKPGTIQLQAHDPQTDVEFLKVRVGHLKRDAK